VETGTLPKFLRDVRTRHDKMVEFTRRVMSDERGTMSTGRDRIAGMVETMLKLHKDLPKAKTPHEQESLQRQIAANDKQIDALVYELYHLTEAEIRIVERERK
jgi:predicted  nucleic acid-binding Zn-ribbon protein